MDDLETDDWDIDAWLASRPTLTEERNHPNHWYNRGADLHASAGALWYAMENDGSNKIAEELGFPSGYSMSVACRPVYHMTCGLALEVIMKAVLTQRGVSFEKTHSLVKLSGLLGHGENSEDLALLKFYEHAVLWAGRYPVPLRCTDEKLKDYWSLAGDVLTSPLKLSKDSTMEFRTGSGAADWDRFTAMWLRMAHLFTSG